MVKPFIKWAGGKSSILNQLIDNLPEQFNNYHEPMLGGGALLLNNMQNDVTNRKYFASDLNEELIQTYNVVKSSLGPLIMKLRKIEKEYLNSSLIDREQLFYKIRAQRLQNPISIAARFIFLNKTCFNGLYRVNKSNQFNVPHGKYKMPKILDVSNLQNISQILQKLHLRQHNINKGYKFAKSNDFVYFDPPFYPISKTADFTSYTTDKFSHDAQLKLKWIVDDLTNRKVYVMLSNSDHPWILGAYQSSAYMIKEVEARRSLSSNVLSRGKINELIITNYHMIN
ncbi:MAG: Dam family site-specific DNA-(adenine-N6)-methyltransferase [Dehalococcoidia bacterium]|nr:Dam family site-specific DNA-(adenine-N6)-methyltransferase [Dehalococcoidia bacterium]